MKKTVITVLAILVTTISLVHAASEVESEKTQTSTMKEVSDTVQRKFLPSPDKTQDEAPKSKPAKYPADGIDLNLQELPPQYLGNDPKQVYAALYDSVKSPKGGFEATRIEKDGLFAFQVGDTNVAPEDREFFTQALNRGIGRLLLPDIGYSAENSEFEIVLKLSHVTKGIGGKFLDENAQSAQLLNEVVRAGDPVASNANEATVNVLKGVVNRYYAAIVNFRQPLFEYEKTWASFNWTFRTKLKSNHDEANNIKPNLRILLIGKIEEPLISSRSLYYEPKQNESTEYTLNEHYIYFRVQEIWVYNQSTGQIYTKIKA